MILRLNSKFNCCLQQLEESLVEFGRNWQLNPGDGAFYGPKVCNSNLYYSAGIRKTPAYLAILEKDTSYPYLGFALE